jgi:hypothetical protein
MLFEESGLQDMCRDESAQDLAEYAVMLAIVLVIVFATLKLISHKHVNAASPGHSTSVAH